MAIDYITDIVSNQVFKPWELKETVPRLKLDLAQLPPSTQALELLHQAAFRYHTHFSMFSMVELLRGESIWVGRDGEGLKRRWVGKR